LEKIIADTEKLIVEAKNRLEGNREMLANYRRQTPLQQIGYLEKAIADTEKLIAEPEKLMADTKKRLEIYREKLAEYQAKIDNEKGSK
jgi:hypothetical protein